MGRTEEAIKEFARLTPRDEYAKRLAELKDEAAREQAESKTAILTKTAQAQINDLQAMIDRYLDDEALKAYSRGAGAKPDRARSQGEGPGQGDGQEVGYTSGAPSDRDES